MISTAVIGTDAAIMADEVAGAIAEHLASPTILAQRRDPPWWPQSLAAGALAVALLHIERARAGLGPWARGHDWLALAAAQPIGTGNDSHLHHGVPALAFVLHHGAQDHPARYGRALAALDNHLATLTRHRLDRAHARIDRADTTTMAEFDAIRGLSGLGALHLTRDPDGDLIRSVLAYLVRLTEPVDDHRETLPGWWTHLDPSGRRSAHYPDGHANNGVAHGIGGPLALLSLAARAGVRVDGQTTAITRICSWLDRWRRDSPSGPWWPHWITRAELRAGHSSATAPGRPSWCYGTAGLARARQLAAIALDDPHRRHTAQTALLDATTPDRITTFRDASVCHGIAGLLRITVRAAADTNDNSTETATTDLAGRVPELLATAVRDTAVTTLLNRNELLSGDLGLFEGAAGVALALHTTSNAPVPSEWDACLLIS
ncbi:MAG: lanthionine synthetase C family protein [Pseudonocardiaceae bacterium]